jgi:APA family basic amino acid/polyamine antiporter
MSTMEVSLGEGGFTRKASGLVRDFSQLDLWIYNVIALNLVINVALTYALVVTNLPHASLWLAIVIAGLFCTAEAVVYAFFAAMMPRSGGDYVFQSRIFGGGVATFFAFTSITLTQMVFFALSAYLGATLVVAPFLILLGAEYHASWLVQFGSWLSSPIGIFVFCLFNAAWCAFINIRGLRTYALVQRYCFWLGLACVGVVLVGLLALNHSDFVANFNSFMATNYNVSDAYNTVIKAGGTTSLSFSLWDTLKASVFMALILAFPAWGVMQAGEVKRANNLRDNLFSIVGAEVFTFLMIALLAFLMVSRVGGDFLFASGQLFFTANPHNPLPVPPFFGFFIALVGNSGFFTWIAFVMFLTWFLMLTPNAAMGGTRVMLAMAFDRVLPELIGKVSNRWHTPVNAVLIFSVGSVIAASLYSFVQKFVPLSFAMIVPSITSFGVTMLAAILMPYTKRKLFDSTVAARYKVLGIPWIVVCAGIFMVFAVFVDYESLSDPVFGINGVPGLIFVTVLYAAALVVYWAAKLYRRTHDNLDLSLVYRELPVE